MKRLKLYIELMIHRTVWLFFYMRPAKSGVTLCKKKREVPDKGKKCAFIPHADDELLGIGHFLKKNAVTLIYFGYTGTETDKRNKQIRDREFRNCCQKHHWTMIESDNKDLIYLTLKDTEFIFLPSIIDWHHEHRVLNWICLDYCHRLGITPRIIWYNISVPLITAESAVYCEMQKKDLNDKYMEFKRDYPSQKNIPVLRFKAKERMYGSQISAHAAEKYLILDFREWETCLGIFTDKGLDRQADKLNRYINDLKLIQSESLKLYEELKQG